MGFRERLLVYEKVLAHQSMAWLMVPRIPIIACALALLRRSSLSPEPHLRLGGWGFLLSFVAKEQDGH